MRNKLTLLFVTLSLIWGCSNPLPYVEVVLDQIERGESELGSPCFMGYLKNEGTATAYNCDIQLRLYGDKAKTDLLEVADGWGWELKQIEPGQQAYFEAPFYIVNHEDVEAWEPLITWGE